MKTHLLLFTLFFCFCAIIYGQPGELDPSFGRNGIVRTNTGSGRDVSAKAKRLMLEPDGSMYILIEAADEKFGTFIKKIRADGSPDTSYGDNGYSKPLPLNPSSSDCCSTWGGAYAAMQPSGKIVVAGSVDSHLGREVLMARYNTDGSLDNSFGEKIENFGTDSQVPLSLTILSDGKIILVCETSNYSGEQWVVAYYNQDGGEKQTTYLNFSNGDAYAFQNDGKIVAALDFNPYAVDRFNIDGSDDTTFLRTEIPSYPSTVAIQSDGKIVVGGPGYISRYNSIGGVDSSFGNNGVITTDYTPGSILFENDGKIVVSVKHNVNNQFFGIVRFNSNGTRDKTLSGDGILLYNKDLDVDSTYYTSTVIGSNGAISIAGYTDKGGLSRIVAARYNSNGSLDKTFDQDGKLTFALHFSDPTNYTSSAVQADGKIVVAGSEVARYKVDGSPDTGFGKNGKVYSGGWNNIAIQIDGKIVVAGSGIARYNTDGQPDVSFGSNGKIRSGDYYNNVAVQGDGKIVVSGAGIARYNKNGSPDLSFGMNGKINSGTTWRGMALQKDGKIVVVGGLYVFEIARFNKDGSIDSTFSEDGYQAIDFAPNDENDEDNYSAEAVAIQDDGKIVVSGQWRYGYRGYGPHITIARYNSDGNLDSTFSNDGELEDYGGSDARSVAIQKDGKIVVGGSARDLGYDKVYDPTFALARYNADGTPDERFNNFQQVSISGTIQKVLISDNKLYAVGGGNVLGAVGIVARYFLSDETKAPAVTLSIPDNIVTYSAPARIKLNALVANVSSTITKVRFYNDTTLIHTETVSPYGFLWTDVPVGTYTLTAKAYDENGNIITSNAISVSVVDSNVAPVVNIINPMYDTTYSSPATIHLIADAHDANDRISKVEFYNGRSLLRTEYIYPYTYNWMNVQPGTYKITAKAYDAKGLSTNSAPVTITINSTTIVSSRSIFGDRGTAINLKLSPNPARSVLQVTTVLSNQDKPTTISIISSSGVVAKTIQTNNLNVQIDVSSLTEGVYTVKVVSGDKKMYKQFVKL